MTNFRRMRFEPKNVDESTLVQKYLFDLGYSWDNSGTNVVNLDKKFLFTELNGDLKCADTLALEWIEPYTRMCVRVIHELWEYDDLIKLNGVLYTPNELEKILQNHKEGKTW